MTPQEAWAQFASDWRAGFEAALAPLFEGGDETFNLELESALVESAVDEGAAWIGFRLTASEDAGLAVGFPREAIEAVGKQTLDEDATSELGLEPYQQAASQASEGALAAFCAKSGQRLEWAPTEQTEAPGERPLASVLTLEIGQSSHRMLLAPQSGLLDAIHTGSDGEENAEPAAGAASALLPSDASALSDEDPLNATGRRNLEMLLDLELDLSVSLGRTELPLDEVVRMTVGSIVQLNRSASDPVDVLVNNSVVARGEVVVIDGNYGVRVTQVASREERLEQML